MSASAAPDRSAPLAGTDAGLLQRRARLVPRSRLKGWLRLLATGDRPPPPPSHLGLYEEPRPEHDDIGVCCSGGGIRSAAFNLGALQALQETPRRDGRRVLHDAMYVAAVSGGSYIAAAFAMVAKTWSTKDYPPGTGPQPGEPGDDDSDPLLVHDQAPPFQSGSPEEQYLRNHLGYLAPDGLARVHLAMRMLAGLLVNVLLIGLPVFILGLLVGWWAREDYGMEINGTTCPPGSTPCHFHAYIPTAVTAIVLVLAGLSVLLALMGVLSRPRHDITRQTIQTWEVRLLLAAAFVAIVLMVVPALAAAALNTSGPQKPSVAGQWLPSLKAASASVIALFASALAHVRGRVRDERNAIDTAMKSRVGRRIREFVVALVVTLAGPILLVAAAVGGTVMAILTAPANALETIDLPVVGATSSAFVAWLVCTFVFLLWIWTITDLTTVSLHPFYRRQLCDAFALKRVWVDEGGEEKPAPSQQPRTGSIEARTRRYDKIVPLSKSGIEAGCCGIKQWPMLIVCAAANISDPGATPPGRAVTSFTFSPSAIGGPLTGSAKTSRYETELGFNRRRDVSLPAAVAMSGAALSPSMGKLTYRPMTFLLGLANIRLGVWVLNPSRVNYGHDQAEGQDRPSTLTPKQLNPFTDRPARDSKSIVHRPRPLHLWLELFGHNRLDAKFLYITDGGHYENLGLVELLRRGCRTIYCFDAGGGSSSGALADAIALARTELNVTISMERDARDLAEDPVTHRAARTCVRGTIVYPATPERPSVEGTLFYVRSVVTDETPWQVLSYQESDPLFPHHSTLDQFFDDRKFEAYRALGHDAASRALQLRSLHAAPAAPVPEEQLELEAFVLAR